MKKLFLSSVLILLSFGFLYAQQTGKPKTNAQPAVKTPASNVTAYSNKSITELVDMLKKGGKDKTDRYNILSVLEGKTPATEQETNMLLAALDDSDLGLQEAAIKVFMNTKDKRAAPQLLTKLKSLPTKAVTKPTEEQIKEYQLKLMAAGALAVMGEKAALPIIIDKLCEIDRQTGEDAITLARCAVLYGKDALPLVEKKIQDVGHKNPMNRMFMMSIISNMQDKEAVSYLKKLYESDDIDIKSAAAHGLRNLGVKVDVSKILIMLKDAEANPPKDNDWYEKRVRLIDELGYSGNQDAVPYIKERIQKTMSLNPWEPNLYTEELALARLGGQDNYQFLLKLYDNTKNISWKEEIIDAIGEGKMKEAIPFLTAIMTNNKADSQLRLNSANSLAKITGDEKTAQDLYEKLKGKEIRDRVKSRWNGK